MAAAKYNLNIEAGATFRQEIIWKDENGVPINLTGCTARMQIRKKITDTDPLISLTSPDNIIITPLEGKIELIIFDNQTETLSDGVYDMEIVFPAIGLARPEVRRLLLGSVFVSKNVTR